MGLDLHMPSSVSCVCVCACVWCPVASRWNRQAAHTLLSMCYMNAVFAVAENRQRRSAQPGAGFVRGLLPSLTARQ